MNITSIRAIGAKLGQDLQQLRWASTLAAGISGGSKYMNLLTYEPTLTGQWSKSAYNNFHNARNPGSSTKYEINPDFFLKDYIDQLSCLVISKDDMGTSFGTVPGTEWRNRYGWIPITKRHVIGCAHALTWASGTWPPNLLQTIPTRVRWRGTDGETVDRIQLHQAVPTLSNYIGYGLSELRDLSVAVLDSDLPDTVYIPRIVPNNLKYREQIAEIRPNVTRYWTPLIDRFGYCQDWPAEPEIVTKPAQSNRSMLWSLVGRYDNLRYSVYGGDSGTPVITVIDGEIMIAGNVGILGSRGVPFFDPNYTGMTWEEYVNKLIEIADDNAIASGRMAERTNYTITVAP